jgi:phosphoglycerate dehydrogenase-like enzyme
MRLSEHILVAQPEAERHLDEVAAAAPGAQVTCVDPITPGGAISHELAATTTVLFADQCPANVAEMPRLRWVQLGSHGYSQLNGTPLHPDAVVTNASGVNDLPIAEWCVMMLLALGRKLPSMLAAQRERRWDRSAAFQAELRGTRVGILGFGNIGREVARHCHALGFEVWVMSRGGLHSRGARYDPLRRPPEDVPRPARVFRLDERADFFAGLDALVVTTPLTSRTRGLVDATALAQLPPGALLLNPARAGVVDEHALIEALRNGRLGGAALDDHYRQPMPPDDPFWDLPNTIVTAHISGSTGSPWYRHRIWDLFITNLRRRSAGEILLNLIARDDLELACAPHPVREA